MASEMFAQSTVTIENRGTKRRSTINWILQYISWEVLSYLLRLIVLCIRYKLNLTADLEGEEQQKELLQGEGFCVMCEKYYGDVCHHMRDFHKNNALALSSCYKIFKFRGIRIMAPFGVYLDSELAKCEPCGGVFYKHRLRNHGCGNADHLIDEGVGPEYCLMCQYRVPDILDHWINVHFMNMSYDIVDYLHGKITLLPKQTDLNANLTVSLNQCDFNCCLILRYKNRIFRPCQAFINNFHLD